jgi:peptide/nickel transport system substrate-binding protein
VDQKLVVPDARLLISRRRLLQVGAASILTAPSLLAACGGDDSSSSPGETSGSQAGDADRTAILRYGQMRGESFDPIRMVAVEDVQLNAIFDTLLTISPTDGTLGPRLATEWEVLDDRIRLRLRDGVVFQDGTPFDAEAVKFSLERVKNDPDSNITNHVFQLAGVEAVDPTTVELLLDPPAALPLLIRLTSRAGMIVSPAAVEAAGSSQAFSNAPVGTGMYRIEGQWQPRESMSVRAWPDYWDEDAQTLGGIDFTEVALGSQVNSLLSNTVDVIGIPPPDVPTIEGNSAFRIMVAEGGGLGWALTLNTTMPPLDNPQVREAMAYAVDREAAAQVMTGGRGQASYQLFGADSPGFLEELEGSYEYDPDRARSLLSDAGFADGVTFGSVIGAQAAQYVQWGEFLQSQLEEAGIHMDLELVDQARTIPMIYRERTAASVPLGPAGMNAAVTDTTIRNSFLADGGTNATGEDMPGVRELLDQAGREANLDDARQYYQDINRITQEQLWVLPFTTSPGIIGYADYVGGITRGFTDVDTNPDLLRGIYVTQGQSAAS